MVMNFSTTSRLAVSSHINMLVYGPAGVGKTMLVASTPSPLLINAESGTLSLTKENIERVYKDSGPYITDIPTVTIQTYSELLEVYQWCCSPQANGFETIYLDSLSDIGEVVLSEAKKRNRDPRKAFGELAGMVEDIIRAFRNLPKNVIMVAKQTTQRDDMGNTAKVIPSMPGQRLNEALPYAYDAVLRMGVAKTQQGVTYRYLQTQPDSSADAKDRTGRLDLLEPPHLGKIIRKMKGQ